MQINHLTLQSFLNKQKTIPRYSLLWGNDPFLLEQSRKTITTHFKQHNLTEKTFIYCDSIEKALIELEQAIQAPDLFRHQQLIIWHATATLKPPERKRLSGLIQQLSEQDSLLLLFDKVTPQQQKEPWYQYCLEQGVVVAHWPMSLNQYQQYLETIATRAAISLNNEARNLLAEMTFGHVQAGVSLIETIALYYANGNQCEITPKQLFNAISQQSRYNLNDLYQAILSGQVKQTALILKRFQANQMPLPLVVWGLFQLLQAICSNPLKLMPISTAPVLPKTPSFQRMLSSSKQHLSSQSCAKLLQQLHALDKQIKSSYEMPLCWQACSALCSKLAYNSIN